MKKKEKKSGEAASQLDIEEALEASRYASHPYSTHRREVSLFEAISLISFVEVGDTGKLPSVIIEKYNTAGGEGTTLCAIFSRDSAGLGMGGQFSVSVAFRQKGLDLPDVLVEVEKCGSSFDELLAVPEQDDWI
ncbi:hypothetical protein F2Q69_00027400 [Brassica cretica]|uniref:Uncharacterized protein n=1 Tax=Brassica cretica TaxID=69181 RepID=A0A8S9RYB3_BRACR|nr:hypothetical protein F2Q69_00027400 [Brassica cretica]